MRLTSPKIYLLLAAYSAAASDVILGNELKVVRYSAQELATMPKESDFVRGSDLSDVLSSKFKEVLVTMTERQSGSNLKTKAVVDASRQISRTAKMKKLSTLAVTPDQLYASRDQSLFFSTISQQYRKALEVNTRKHFPIVEKIRSGMKFNLDLKDPTISIVNRKEIPVIRYGLVETEIIPSKDAIPIASLGSISDVHTEFGSKAQVIYTIDKLSNERARPVFGDGYTEDEEIQHTSLWSRIPSAKINVKIDASDQDAIMADQLGNGSIPGARFSFSQVDGLISTQFIAGGKSPTNKSLIHQIKVPLYGEMSLSRQFDYKMQAINTSALNVLGDSKRPRLNLLFSHKDKRAKGEWIMRKTRSELSLVAEPRQGWTPSLNNSLGRAGDRLSVSFNKSF